VESPCGAGEEEMGKHTDPNGITVMCIEEVICAGRGRVGSQFLFIP